MSQPDLRHLCVAIHALDNTIQTARRHPLLALHLTLLHAAQLITIEAHTLRPTPTLSRWLAADPQAQLADMRRAVDDDAAWHNALATFGFAPTVTCDRREWARQQLGRYAALAAETPHPAAIDSQPDRWVITLPATLQPADRFTLLQLGTLPPFDSVTMTPLTLADAIARGHGLLHSIHHLQQAQQAPLTTAQVEQLHCWQRHAGAVRLRPATLLTTATPEQFSAIRRQRRLAQHIHEQLTPRHAIVSAKIARPLRRHLAAAGHHLAWAQPDNAAVDPDPALNWLALRVLAGLRSQLPLDIPDLRRALDGAAAPLDATELTALQSQADTILAGVARAIAGKDAFFPARAPVADTLIATIADAIAAGAPLHIVYQGLGEAQPRRRIIEPLHLEQRGALYYLHAYCRLAQAERCFRLDRVREMTLSDAKQ